MSAPIGREVSPGHRIVSSEMLPEHLTECPHCGSKTFSVIGDFHRAYKQDYIDGKPVEEGPILHPQAIQSIEGIECLQCNIHTLVESEEIFERESLILDLHTQIAVLQGRAGQRPGKEWKN